MFTELCAGVSPFDMVSFVSFGAHVKTLLLVTGPTHRIINSPLLLYTHTAHTATLVDERRIGRRRRGTGWERVKIKASTVVVAMVEFNNDFASFHTLFKTKAWKRMCLSSKKKQFGSSSRTSKSFSIRNFCLKQYSLEALLLMIKGLYDLLKLARRGILYFLWAVVL